MTKKKKPGPLSPDEEALWAEVTRDIKPMKAGAKSTPSEGIPDAKASPKPAPRRQSSAGTGAAKAPGPEKPAYAPGSGLDGRSETRLRRGQLEIDAKLDLHGMTQAQAHGALDKFLARAQDRGKRCVLVVTGKGGKVSEDPDNMFTDKRTGVLRAAVPRWLGEGGNRARVLSFSAAQPRHGGDGALYVLLRRQR